VNEIATHQTDLRNLNFMLDIYISTLEKKRIDLNKTTITRYFYYFLNFNLQKRDELIEIMKKAEQIYFDKL